MNRTCRLLLIWLMLTFAGWPIRSVSALGPADDGSVIFGGEYRLRSGETHGDLVVFGGKITIEEGATVQGSIVIFGGSSAINGTVTGDLLLFGGECQLGEKALVQGDLLAMGGDLHRAEGARVEGQERREPALRLPLSPELPWRQAWQTNLWSSMMRPAQIAFGVVGQAILLGLLALVLTLFLQPQMEQVAKTITSRPLIAGGAGLLTVIVAPIVAILMLLTILLIPLVPLVALAMVVGWLFGTVSLGHEIGDRLRHVLHLSWSSPLTAGVGTFLLVLVVQGIGQIPCFGWTVPFLVGMIGLGGVVLDLLEARKSLGTGKPAGGEEESPSLST